MKKCLQIFLEKAIGSYIKNEIHKKKSDSFERMAEVAAAINTIY